MKIHHFSILCADIWRSLAFYEALGFVIVTRFTAGTTLGCWLEGLGMRLELMQVPTPSPPANPFGDEGYVGYYHLSLAVDDVGQTLEGLGSILGTVRILLLPREQIIGDRTYRVSFIADPDGLPIELLQDVTVH
ncbi:MAG: VOC family protein [Oscillatoriales cyanobacterium SM2_2_1]|nr:VOC family protein [Oscillatoriales cyanobacterium SM2_2_1]